MQGLGEMGAGLMYLQDTHTVTMRAHQPQAGAMGSLLVLLGRCPEKTCVKCQQQDGVTAQLRPQEMHSTMMQ